MGVTEPVSSGMPRSESGDTATSKLPLPQGEGWGEGKETNTPSVPTLLKNLPLNKSGDEPADRKAIIKEFREAMDKGDERAALRAEAKYRRIDTKAEKNIYDYGPNDPDPTIDYYFEPLNPEEQAKFDEEERREYGLTEEEIADFTSIPATASQIRPARATHPSRRRPQHTHPPQPARRQAQKPHHPQPLAKIPFPSGRVPA